MNVLVVDPTESVRVRVARALVNVPGVDDVVQAGDVIDGLNALNGRDARLVVLRSRQEGLRLDQAAKAVRRAIPDARVVAYVVSADEAPSRTPAELGVHRVLDLPRETPALVAFAMQHVAIRVQWVQPNSRHRR